MPRSLFAALLAGALLAGSLSADDRGEKEKKGNDALKYAAVTITKLDPKSGQITVKYRVDDRGEEKTKTFQHTKEVRLLDETGRTLALDVFEAGTEALVLETDGQLKEIRRYSHGQRGHRLSDAVATLVEMAGSEEGSVDEVQRIYDMLRKLDPTGTGKVDPAAVKAESDRIVGERVKALIKRIDSDGDGKIARAESRGIIKEHFDKLDPNKDGSLDYEELLRAAKERRDTAPPQGERK